MSGKTLTKWIFQKELIIQMEILNKIKHFQVIWKDSKVR